jgi:6-phosphofructokinase
VNLIAENLHIKARYDKPGTIQRGSMVCASPVDLDETYRAGEVAVANVVESENDKMITLVRKSKDPYECETGLVELDDVALKTRHVPDAFINEQANFVTGEFFEYLRPLIGGRLPEYTHLRKEKLKKILPSYT